MKDKLLIQSISRELTRIIKEQKTQVSQEGFLDLFKKSVVIDTRNKDVNTLRQTYLNTQWIESKKQMTGDYTYRYPNYLTYPIKGSFDRVLSKRNSIIEQTMSYFSYIEKSMAPIKQAILANKVNEQVIKKLASFTDSLKLLVYEEPEKTTLPLLKKHEIVEAAKELEKSMLHFKENKPLSTDVKVIEKYNSLMSDWYGRDSLRSKIVNSDEIHEDLYTELIVLERKLTVNLRSFDYSIEVFESGPYYFVEAYYSRPLSLLLSKSIK